MKAVFLQEHFSISKLCFCCLFSQLIQRQFPFVNVTSFHRTKLTWNLYQNQDFWWNLAWTWSFQNKPFLLRSTACGMTTKFWAFQPQRHLRFGTLQETVSLASLQNAWGKKHCDCGSPLKPIRCKLKLVSSPNAWLSETKLLSSSAQNVRDTTKNLKHLATKRKPCAPDNVWSFCLQDFRECSRHVVFWASWLKITLKDIETWFCTLALAVTVPQNINIYKRNLNSQNMSFLQWVPCTLVSKGKAQTARLWNKRRFQTLWATLDWRKMNRVMAMQSQEKCIIPFYWFMDSVI